MKKATLPIPASTLARLLIGLAVCSVFVLLLLLPDQEKDKALADRIRLTRVEIEEQQVLFPFYKGLERQLKENRYGELPMPEQQSLTQDQLYDVLKLVETAATGAGLEVKSLEPAPESVTQAQGLLLVNTIFNGSFDRLPEFLKSVGAVPHLKHVEHVRIEEAAAGGMVQMKLWLALKKD